MGGKRKATPAEHGGFALRYDAKLATVSHALRNLTRADESDAFTSGAFDAFPLPVVRLTTEDNASELALPLTPQGVDAIVRRVKTANASEDNQAVLVVKGADVELRNRRWPAFVEKIVTNVREPLGISNAAEVNATLRELVLVRTGGRLPISARGDEPAGLRKRGVFGTLVIALPGEFTGGEIAVFDDEDGSMPSELWIPRSLEGDNTYDVEYVAFYNSAPTDAMPVTNGDALCLVYDLTTTTVGEVPRFAGEQVLEQVFNDAMIEYFDVLPPSKRFKVSDDAWRKINEFISSSRLVHPVTGSTFESLRDEDSSLARHLVHFCERSSGQYVLYLVGLRCTRTVYNREDADDYSKGHLSVTLGSPWLKHGETNPVPFPDSPVDHLKELLPAGFLESLVYEEEEEEDSEDEDEDDYYDRRDSWYDREDNYSKTQRHHRHALVVIPATMERVLWSKMPFEHAVAKLRHLMETSPQDAVPLARRVVMNRPRWINTDPSFVQFLEVVLVLNDFSLFCDLLRSVSSYVYERERLRRAVQRFGWDKCLATIKNIVLTVSFSSRVNLIGSLLDASDEPSSIDGLLSVLTELPPWTQTTGPASSYPVYAGMVRGPPQMLNPNTVELARIFTLARKTSMETITKLLHVPSSLVLYQVIIPAFARSVGELPAWERSPYLPKIQELYQSIKSSLPSLQNASFAACRIPEHCDKCREIQSFLASTARETTILIKGKAQLKHVETVVKRRASLAGPISTTHTPPNVVLSKLSMSTPLSVAAQQCFALLASLLR